MPNMTDEQIRELIATKVMGWVKDEEYAALTKAYPMKHATAVLVAWWTPQGTIAATGSWNPTENIDDITYAANHTCRTLSAATSRVWAWEIGIAFDETYYARIVYCEKADPFIIIEAHYNTDKQQPARALCLVVLEAVGVEVE